MAVVSLWLVGALVLPLLLWLWLRGAPARARLARCGEQIPGPRPLPLIGNLLELGFDTKKVYEVVVRLYVQYGPLFRVWMGPGLLSVNLVDPQDIEALLSKNKNLTKAFNYDFLRSWIGQGLLTSTGDRWRKHRKIITPTFHFNILEQFVEVFNKQGDILVSVLKKVGDDPFDITPFIDMFTQDVISETAMGVELNSQTEGYASSYLQSVKDMCELLLQRSAKPWLYPQFIYRFSSQYRREIKNLKILHGLTNEVIQKRRKVFEENPSMFEETLDDFGRKRKLAFLDLLLYYTRDGSLSDEEIREEVDTFMFEGHDTTASAISFAVMELSKNSDIQRKIVDELKEVCNAGSSELLLSFEKLNNLKYIEQVIKETLRMYPSVPVYARQTTEDFELATRPVVVPPGVTVTVIPAMLHRNVEHFSNPDEFNPDNFSPEAVMKRHPYAFLPFSAGPRNCIGQKFAMLEMKSALAKIIWNFTLEIDPSFELEMLPEITLKSLHGVRLSIKPRVHG